VKGAKLSPIWAPHHRGPHRPRDRALSAVICVGRFDHPAILARRAPSCPAHAACGPQLSHAAPSNLAVEFRYSTDSTCAHTTIIPMNRVMDASAAASSTTARIMLLSPRLEHRGNVVHDMFFVNDAFELQRTSLTSARGATARMRGALKDLQCVTRWIALWCSTICVCSGTWYAGDPPPRQGPSLWQTEEASTIRPKVGVHLGKPS
jgi:hypothetical protein